MSQHSRIRRLKSKHSMKRSFKSSIQTSDIAFQLTLRTLFSTRSKSAWLEFSTSTKMPSSSTRIPISKRYSLLGLQSQFSRIRFHIIKKIRVRRTTRTRFTLQRKKVNRNLRWSLRTSCWMKRKSILNTSVESLLLRVCFLSKIRTSLSVRRHYILL